MPDSTAPIRSSNLKAILTGGLSSGACDLIFAFIYYGNRGATPVGILHSVAGGLLGKKASYEGGAGTAALGFGLHFLISCSAATVYLLASRRFPLLRNQPVPCGIVYGAIVYFFMKMVVLPLSAYHSPVFPLPLVFAPIAIHLFGIGLPIALATWRYAKQDDLQRTPAAR